MYKHLLVPLGDSPASQANVQASVELARQLQARITFFHATPDWGATSDGTLLRTLQPDIYSDKQTGETNALLAKAAACAQALHVDCSTLAHTSDRPAEAIVEAAQEHGCDLIVMASRGGRHGHGLGGWLHSSQTERVLSHAPVALLVTRVETAHPLHASDRALAIIQDEHRSIAVVVRGMRELTRNAAAMDNADALERMVEYLYDFPERVHHPKEESHIHRFLRQWAPQSGAMIDEVESQHKMEHDLLDRVSECLKRMRTTGAADDAIALAAAVDRMADCMLQHMGFEERVLLPLAKSTLVEDDWQQIADAFAVNDDPRYGDLSAEQFRRIFTGIANTLARRAAVAAQ